MKLPLASSVVSGLLYALSAASATAADLSVGLDKPFHTVCSAVAVAAQSGDRILVDAGIYTDDTCLITKSHLDLIAMGGVAVMVATKNIGNGKAIFVTSGDISFSNFAWQGAQVADGNGAGIRHERGNLSVSGWGWFVYNQNGILASDPPTGVDSTVTIRSMYFGANGIGDGRTHNMYFNHINKLTLQNVCSVHANVGHAMKSRAAISDISSSWFETRSRGIEGTGSYELDFPNGGIVKLSNVFVQQGNDSGNPNMIAYGEEGGLWSINSFTMDSFVLVNDRSAGGTGVWNPTANPVQLTNGQVYGLAAAQVVNGTNTQSGVQITRTPPAATSCDGV
jgi:hypothetical protein